MAEPDWAELESIPVGKYNAKPMIHDDPLLRTYRDAAELYLRVVDMPPELQQRYLTTVCVGRDLLKFTIEELVRGDEADGAGEDARCVSADRVTATLVRFTDALNTAPAQPEVTAYVPGAYDSDRERTLAELVKLEQKFRWAARRPKPLEVYLREWPELRGPATVAELLRSECLTRAVYGSPASDRELSLRFPNLSSTIDLNALEKRAQMIARALSSGGSGVAPTADRFSIVRKIGQGGMGIVYEAIDRQRGSTVALKTLPHMDPRALFRLKREFRTLADLVHPNLVSLYELVSDGSEWLFTMELVDGVDFMTHVGSRTPGGRIDDDALRSLALQLAEGVSALHASQILHCDLKPSNVLVRRDGRVVILDFGIAKELSRGRSATEATPGLQAPTGPAMRSTWTVDEYVMGSVAYMSPEQAEGIELTPASDWYSMGAMLYEALAGQIPFAGDPDLMWTKQLQDATPPSGIAANVPQDLEDLCMALLSREPDDRPDGPAILQLLADRRSTSRAPATTPRGMPFVGRAHQLAILDSAYAKLRECPTVAVHIHGKSGAGKTALAQQFLATLPAGTTVLAGRCYEQESVPYKALDSVIDRLCRHLMQLPSSELSKLIPADIAALARIFPVLQRIDDIQAACAGRPEIPDLRELRRRAFAALAALLHGLSETAPLVVFIDDLQWGDVDSAALLLSLLDTPHPPPMLFVACYRAEYTDSNPCLRALAAAREHQVCFDVGVEPLPFGDSLTLASSLLPAADADTTARVAVESGGNPYFLYELAWQLNGAAANDAASLTLNLDEVLWRRVTMLPPEARHLLEVIATAAKPLPLNRAADAGAFQTDVAAAVSVLRAEHLVRTTGPSVDDYVETYHDRIRETVSSHLSESERREHHRRLAIALEAAGHTDLEETASHFHRAELPEMAAQHYALAAEKSSAALAFQRSAELYGLAIGLGHPEGAPARQLHRRRADALANAGRGYDAGQEYQLAARWAEPHDIIELQRNAGYQFCVSGHIDEGREAFGVVLAHLGMKLPRTRRQALLSLLWRRFRLRLRGMRVRERPEHMVSREVLDRVDIFWSVASGMTIADPIRGADFQTHDLILALEAGEPYRIARALAWEAAHISMIGVRLRHRAYSQLAAAESLAKRLDRPHATGVTLMSRGVAAYFFGDFETCQRCTTEATAIFREHCTGVAWELETCTAFAYWPLYFKGEYGELTRRFGPLIAEVRERGARLAEADLTTFGGPFVWLAADDPDGADRAVRGVMGAWSQQDFQVQHFTTLTAEAQIGLYRGDYEEAWRRVTTQWAGVADAMLLHVEIVRIYMRHLRARCALAAATGRQRDALLTSAARDARRLERERPPYAHALAKPIRSALAFQAGDRSGAAALLSQAADELNTLGWGCFGVGARRQYGELIGGGEGRRIVKEVDEHLMQQGVKRPDLLCSVQVPGFQVHH